MIEDDEPQVVGRRRVPKIPEVIPQVRRCSICRDKRKTAYVDANLAKGLSAASISRLLDDLNLKTSPTTISSHQKHYIPPPPKSVTKAKDLAILVRDEAMKAVEEGRLQPTIRDGLAAVQIIEKRAERVTGREMFLMMARALTGGGPIGLLEPPDDLVIEGEAVEVE